MVGNISLSRLRGWSNSMNAESNRSITNNSARCTNKKSFANHGAPCGFAVKKTLPLCFRLCLLSNSAYFFIVYSHPLSHAHRIYALKGAKNKVGSVNNAGQDEGKVHKKPNIRCDSLDTPESLEFSTARTVVFRALQLSKCDTHGIKKFHKC